ncbi:MAG: hypothetical protein ACT4P3_17820 [Betaproteobacteria bacterium]
MQATTAIRQRWGNWHPSKAQIFWSTAGAVVITLILGFGPGGWVTGGSARKQAEQAASDARHQLAAAVCTEEFMREADARKRLETIKKAMWYERNRMVSDGGWATMPDRKEANMIVASMCAERLAQL